MLREMGPADRNYVMSSWLRSYAAKGSGSRDYAKHADFYDDYARVVRGLLARSTVLVAGLADAPDVIAGWAAWEGDVLHYVVTKPNFRRLGIATWLLQDFCALPVAYTHRTSDAALCKIPEAWTYRRYRIWPQETAA